MKAFKHKPEQVIGELFDGTPESAKKILDWFRSYPDSGYQYHHFQLKETRYNLDKVEPVHIQATPCLELHSEDDRFYLTPGMWLILDESNAFKSFRNEWLSDHYDEI